MKHVIILFLLLVLTSLTCEEKILNFYIDADRTGAKESGLAIEKGVRLALSEIDYKINGYIINVIIRDHRGNSRRSYSHLKEYLLDPNGLVVFCGLHSPPVLANLDYINRNGILLLNPWAAAAPITRSVDSNGDNWIFRLSIDDDKAGEVIVNYTIDLERYKKPALLLEDTGWGTTNKKNMTAALLKRGIKDTDIFRFRWGIKSHGARELLNDIFLTGADSIVFVGNAPEGKTFIKAMSERSKDKRLPIKSHWGITGGNIFEELGANVLVKDIDLTFLQTSYSFLDSSQDRFKTDFIKRVYVNYPSIKTPIDIKAPNGLIHGYDLTKILIQAISESSLTGDIIKDRGIIRSRLESINKPVKGLIKTYNKPFSKFSKNNPNAHEALDIEDFVMAKYGVNGGIYNIRR